MRDALAQIIFAETSTIGLRFHPVERLKLHREIREVETRFGRIRIKVSRAQNGAHAHDHANLAPEYDDCKRAAVEHGVALRVVIEEAREAARRQLS